MLLESHLLARLVMRSRHSAGKRIGITMALTLTSLIPITAAVARGPATIALPPHMASVSAHGLMLTIETPRAAYPRDALVPVTVSLHNSNDLDARVELCAGFLPSVQLRDSAGHPVNQPPIPLGMTHPPCFDPTVPVPLSIGTTLHWSGLLILHAPRVRASESIYSKNAGNALFGRPSIELQTPDLEIRTLPPVRTRATIQSNPSLHATVRVPPRGRIYYTDRTECSAPYRGVTIGGTTEWTAANGSIIEPSSVEGCTSISRWQLAVAVEGEAPVWIDRRIAPPALPAGGTISAGLCRSNPPPPDAGTVAATWRGSIYLVAVNGSHTCRLTASIGARAVHLSPDGQWVVWSAPETRRPWITDLWVGRSDGRATPRRIPGASFNTPYPTVVWSPGGRFFAYGRAGSIFLARPQGGIPHVLSSDGRHGTLPLAWMPNGSAVVARKYDTGGEWPHQVDLTIDGLRGETSTAAIRFPSWISNPHARPIGSYPQSDITISAGGTHVFLSTSGGGVQVSGVWEAGLRFGSQGDTARLILGTRARVRGYPAPAAHLKGATHLFASPDGRYVAVDPTTGFWVVDTGTLQGRMLRIPPQTGCVVSQSVWWSGRPGIAFVTTCPLNGGTAFRSTLWSASLSGGAPYQLLTVIDRQPDGISIGTVYRQVHDGSNPGSLGG